jgi:hypothetical protein
MAVVVDSASARRAFSERLERPEIEAARALRAS